MAQTLSSVTQAITSTLSHLPSAEKIEEAERMQLLGALDKLRVALEPPAVSIQNLCFGAHGIAAVRIAQGMGIMDAFVASGGTEMTLGQLHEKTKGDEQLLLRVVRLLCCQNIVNYVGNSTYKPTPLALMLSNGSPPGDAINHFYSQMPITAGLYNYFEANGYRNPGDAYNGPFQYGMSTKHHYFQWLNENPEDQRAFNSVMTMGRAYRSEEWFEFFPVEQKLQTSPQNVVLVDVGGGIGHDIREFKAKFPHLPGKLVLQDLSQVIDDIKDPLPDDVDAIKYDMFTEQPIKSAKAYYMRTVLHDWPDKQALIALARIRDAMDHDSILLLNENTLPADNAPVYSAHLDWTMMEVFGSLERTEQQWIDLIIMAGFKIVNTWKPKVQATSSNVLFEAALK